jgi:GT2 family glycosyltransferase
MNYGLNAATGTIVLFLDDDITADVDLIGCHQRAHSDYPDAVAVVGQVLQPGESPVPAIPRGPRRGLRADLEFPFFSSRDEWIANVMAGNLSVKRADALAAGGFDENFVGVAYRFETEFARRLQKVGGKIRFCPEASINHLRAGKGGTRATGSHMASASPKYGIGDHYYAFLHGSPAEAWTYSIKRVFREVRTKFHLTHPWWIPVKLVGELRAIRLARKLIKQGPALIGSDSVLKS